MEEEIMNELRDQAVQERVLKAIRTERAAQDKKWGQQNHGPADWLAILAEEVGEANKAYLDARFEGKDPLQIETELIQVAAVCVAIIESLHRNGAI